MKQLWSKDYNELHRDRLEWVNESRNNKYAFVLRDGRTKPLGYFCRIYEAKSVIDYGCGNVGNHFTIDPSISVYNYDPFVAEYATRPKEAADLIVCYNVLNVIEPEFIDDVLDDLYSLTKKALICKIRIPGPWISDPLTFVNKVTRRFDIKEFSYTKNELNKLNLFLQLEKKKNDD